MRYLLIILILVHFKTLGQDYVSKFKTVGKETGVVNYQILRGIDSTNMVTVQTIQPAKGKDSNLYVYAMLAANYYYKFKILYTTGPPQYTKAVKVINTNVSITSAVLKINTYTDNLSWTANNEAAVSYYSIERSTNNGVVWSLVGKLTQTGKKNYVVNVSKSGATRRYRVRAFYLQDLISPYTNFN